MSKEIKVAREVAEEAFEAWAEDMDLDIDETLMDEDDKGTFNKHKARILKAIMRGSLIFNEDGEAVYTPSNEKSKHQEAITFHERSGASLMSMGGKKKEGDAEKMYAVMGQMCKVNRVIFAGLVGVDIKVCETLFSFLME